MSDKTTEIRNDWPDNVRLQMIERSEFYSEPKIYQYGYYDGYQNRFKDKRVAILQKIIEKFGIEQQREMIIEECSELIQAIQKLKRAGSNHNAEEPFFKQRWKELQGEIADVSLMIMQAKIMFGEEEIEKIMDDKLERIKPRLEERVQNTAP